MLLSAGVWTSVPCCLKSLAERVAVLGVGLWMPPLPASSVHLETTGYLRSGPGSTHLLPGNAGVSNRRQGRGVNFAPVTDSCTPPHVVIFELENNPDSSSSLWNERGEGGGSPGGAAWWCPQPLVGSLVLVWLFLCSHHTETACR